MAAAMYNIIWGTAVIVFPAALFELTGIEPPRYPQIWQCVGMIVGVYGLGYALAARDPYRHWPMVLVGLVGKVLGPIGFVAAAVRGELPWAWGATIVTNDLIWWLPFGALLYGAARFHSDTGREVPAPTFPVAIRRFVSQRGSSLYELSSKQPTLVVFLRHSGCTFCREALSDLRRDRSRIEELGLELAVVHMGAPMDATLMLNHYSLEGVHHFSDPQCVLYRAFGLPRGNWRQLFSLRVIQRAIAAWWKGHGLGRLNGDGFRMPGAFVLEHGRVVHGHLPRTAADRAEYLHLARKACGVAATSREPSPQRHPAIAT
jgi:peroxiredoxin